MARSLVLRKARQLSGRRRKPNRRNRHNRNNKVSPASGGPAGARSKEVMAKRKRGDKLFATLCAENLTEGLTDGASYSALRMAMRCGNPAMNADIIDLTAVRTSQRSTQGQMASLLSGSVALAASIPLPDSGRCAAKAVPVPHMLTSPCKRRADEDLDFTVWNRNVGRVEGLAPWKRRMLSMYGGACTSSEARGGGMAGVIPINSCVEQGRESGAGRIDGDAMNIDSGSWGAGGQGNCERMFLDRLGFEVCGSSSGGLIHSSENPAAAGLVSKGGAGDASVPVIGPVGSAGDSGTKLHDSMCLGIRDNPTVQPSSISSGEPECSGAGKGAPTLLDRQTENSKKCLDVWLDSLPDMLPGALLSPDDAYDNLPPPSPVQCQEESISAVQDTNPTSETPMQQQSSMAPQHLTERKPIVFIWDLDETLILSTSLSTGQYAQFNEDLDAKKLADLGVDWSKASSYVAEKHLFSKQV